MCRICHCESEIDAPLISPCVCSGSLKYVHQACLQQWIKSANTKSCELCKFDFQMTTRVKPFRKVSFKREREIGSVRSYCVDMTIHCIDNTTKVVLIYIIGILTYIISNLFLSILDTL